MAWWSCARPSRGALALERVKESYARGDFGEEELERRVVEILEDSLVDEPAAVATPRRDSGGTVFF